MDVFIRLSVLLVSAVAALSVQAGEWQLDQSGPDGSTYHIYIPEGTGEKSLMLNLHGCIESNKPSSSAYDESDTPSPMTPMTLVNEGNWETVADAENMIVVIPESEGDCWRPYGTDQQRDNYDNEYLIDLVKQLKADDALNIAPKKVYVSGLGAGATQAMLLGCLAPEQFAGIGAVAGPVIGTEKNENIEGPVPAITSADIVSTCTRMADDKSDFLDTQIASIVSGHSGDYAISQWWSSFNIPYDGSVSNLYSEANADAYGDIFNAYNNPSNTYQVDGGGVENRWLKSNQTVVSYITVEGMEHGWPVGGEEASVSDDKIVTGFINYPEILTSWLSANNRRIYNNTSPVADLSLQARNGNEIGIEIDAIDDGSISEVEITGVRVDGEGDLPVLSLAGDTITEEDDDVYIAAYTGLVSGAYLITVEVTDDEGASTKVEDYVYLNTGSNFNQRPVVSIDTEEMVNEGCFKLTGMASDSAPGELNYVLVSIEQPSGYDIYRSAALVNDFGRWEFLYCGVSGDYAKGSVKAVDNLGYMSASEYFNIRTDDAKTYEQAVTAYLFDHVNPGTGVSPRVQYGSSEYNEYAEKYGTNAFDGVQFTLFDCGDEEWTDDSDDCEAQPREGVDLSLSMIPVSANPVSGETIAYDVVVSNYGDTEEDAEFVFNLPENVTFEISGDADCDEQDDGEVRCNLFSIDPESDPVEFQLQLEFKKEEIGNITIQAELEHGSADQFSSDNQSKATIYVQGETRGINLSEKGTLITSQDGGEATFNVSLTYQPVDDVVLNVQSTNYDRGDVSPLTLTFTPANWNITQPITVKGQALSAEDQQLIEDADDNEVIELKYQVVVSVNKINTKDDQYDAVSSQTVQCVNQENGEPAVLLLKHFEDEPGKRILLGDEVFSTTESGSKAYFQVMLNSPPQEDVIVRLETSKLNEGGLLDGASVSGLLDLLFTPSNYNQPQLVTVVGQDDAYKDGDKSYQITVTNVSSDDSDYAAISGGSVDLVNIDNDTAGVRFEAAPDLETSESPDAVPVSFDVVLNKAPVFDVDVKLQISNVLEGALVACGDDDVSNPSVRTFTPENYATAQKVCVKGVDDQEIDGDQAFTVYVSSITSAAPDYQGLNDNDRVTIVNVDDDALPGIELKAMTSLVTDEDETKQVILKLRLTSEPEAVVNVTLASRDTSEGVVISSAVVFDPSITDDWKTYKEIIVEGVNDSLKDGDQRYTVYVSNVTSTDEDYNDKNFDAEIELLNLDNEDNVGVEFDYQDNLETSEDGDMVSFTIKLTSKPVSNVYVLLQSDNEDEGVIVDAQGTEIYQIEFSPADFDPTSGEAEKTVFVKGQDDDDQDGDVNYAISISRIDSDDISYSDFDVNLAGTVPVTNLDNDMDVGVLFFGTTGLETTELGATTTFSVVLKSEPSSDVTITLASADNSEGEVISSPLVFTPANWDELQTVTVKGKADDIDDGVVAYFVKVDSIDSDDAGYDNLNLDTLSKVEILNKESDEEAGVNFESTGTLYTTEDGGAASFTIELVSQPSSNVYIELESSDTNEGVLNNTQITFTPANWNIPQVVTVTGVDDEDQEVSDDPEDFADGEVMYQVRVISILSTDSRYAGLNPANTGTVQLTNIDNDTAGLHFIADDDLETSESGSSVTFSVVLDRAPEADVEVVLDVSDDSEGRLVEDTFIFTPENWSVAQTVTVSGRNDNDTDGDVAYSVIVKSIESADGNYFELTQSDQVVIVNNDTPTVEESNEGGGGAMSALSILMMLLLSGFAGMIRRR